MGKGDKRSKKGKIWSSSYGKSRPHKLGTGYSATSSDDDNAAKKAKGKK